jgi:glucose-6-phosphate 1-dehydrogenase
VEQAWPVVRPILEACQAVSCPEFPNYPVGSWQPRETDELLQRGGRQWRKIDG